MPTDPRTPKKTPKKIDEDYFEFVIDDPRSKLVTSNFIRGRRIVLRGIGAFVQVKNGRPEIGYSYQCLGPLCQLVKGHPCENDFTFNPKAKKWFIT